MSDDRLFNWAAGYISAEEDAVSDLIASLGALTPADKVKAQLCRSLARSIAEGNRKGRSVAQDVERLAALVHDLAGSDLTDSHAGLTDEERTLLDALANAPTRPGHAEIPHTPQP